MMNNASPETAPSVPRIVEERSNPVVIPIHDEQEEYDKNSPELKKKRRSKKLGEDDPMRAPKHVHGGDWKDMMHLTANRKRDRSATATSVKRTRTHSSVKMGSWIESRIKKVECNTFIPTQKALNRCGCGALEDQHSDEARHLELRTQNFLSLPGGARGGDNDEEGNTDGEIPRVHRRKWTIARNTISKPTDCYGTIVFEGSSHLSRAHFVRAAFDTEPDTIMRLIENVWKLPPPKLIITIHGGLTNFDLQPKLARIFRKGILKAAKSTDAWIITTGLNAGVVRHVEAALEDLGSSRSKSRVLAIGIAPWGMLKKKQRFEGKDVTVNYSTNIFNKSRLAEINGRHSYFIFADNGTTGRYGAEIILRKRLETYLARRASSQSGAAPVVCVVLEGGAFTIKVVHDYVSSIPTIPVVVCDGSGRAADLLAFTQRAVNEDGVLPESVKLQLLSLVENVFNYDRKNASRVLRQLHECAKHKNLLTVFRLGESGKQDVDYAILKALLRGKNLSPPEQLQLALAWNRADIARSEIFTMGTEWSSSDLHEAMMEALCHDRTAFVQLLLENGVSMHRFLTYGRLEHLYNTEDGPNHTLRGVIGSTSKHFHIKLPDVGHAMEKLMGNAYKSNYTKEDFKAKYFVFSNRKQLGYQKSETMRNRQRSENLSNEHSMKLDLLKTARHSIISIFGGVKRSGNDDDDFSHSEEESLDFTFKYPYSELLIWAVLTKRQEMAMLMWRHGEEAMAKSLVACKLYASLCDDASSNFLELETCEELASNSENFRQLSIELLQYCSAQNTDQTLQLLTYQLSNWGNETCLSLAAMDNNRKFIAHPCSQLLLTDLWHGGMRIRNNSNIKVLLCVLFPPGIFLLGFKSEQELRRQPHTAAEHHDENWESDSDGEGSLYFDTTSSESEEEEVRHRSPSDGQILSFQQLMKEKMPFRRADGVAPIANGVNGSVYDGKPRSISLSKVKRKANGRSEQDTDEIEEEDRLYRRRRSTGKKSMLVHEDHYRSRDNLGWKEKQTQLSWTRKLTEFYSAPITTFWLWSLSFFVFLVALTYSLLLETRRHPTWVEWYLFCYVLVWSLEVARKCLMTLIVDAKAPVHRKVAAFFFNYRNGVMSFALITYLIAFFIRLNPSTRALGRVLLASNSVLWSLKLIDYLGVHRQLGPYITMASEMIPRMLPILCMLFVALLSFGLIRQSITFPYESEWNWLLVRNIFYKPYFMLYGEVYAPEIDTCGDEIWDTHIDDGTPISQLNVTHETCVPGYFMVPIFMTVFMVIANVLLMNTMVACCTYIFEQNVESTQEIWLFKRYREVMEYESTPFLPPPFTIVFLVYWFVKWVMMKEHFLQRTRLMDASLKLFLSEDEVDRIHSFEEDNVEDMEREKDMQRASSNDERIHRTAERSELLVNRVNTVVQAQEAFRRELQDVQMKSEASDQMTNDKLDQIKQLSQMVETLLQAQGLSVPSTSQPVSILKKRGDSGRRRSSGHGSGIPQIKLDLLEPHTSPKPDRSRRRVSITPAISPAVESDNSDNESLASRSSKRRQQRRNSEYTSIADSIILDPELYNDSPYLDVSGDVDGVTMQSEESDTGELKIPKH